MITFSQFLVDEEEAIADNKIYLSNMAKSFKDKAWFIPYMSKDIDLIVDFGGGAGEFAEYCQSILGKSVKFVIVDNNPTFLEAAKEKGFECFKSLDELLASKLDLSRAMLVLSSVIHEVYSYKDDFYDDVGVFWSDIKKCKFKAIAIRDMTVSKSAYDKIPVDAVLWVYQNVLNSSKLTYKGHTMAEITNSFEDIWGAICDVQHKKVDVHRLVHFLIKYRYQENWEREVRENYLPVSQDKLQYWLEDFLGMKLVHKESSHLDFYDKCWAKDFKLSIPDNNGFKKQFLVWLKQLKTHIKWLAEA